MGKKKGNWTYISVLINSLLNLNVLDIVTGLDVQDTVQVKSSLQLADHEVILSIRLDTLDGESADPRVHGARQGRGLGVPSLKIEGVLAVESQDLSRRHDIALVEDSQASSLIGNIGGLFPCELDGVVDDIMDSEISDTESRRQDSASESTAASDGLVLVKSEGQVLAEILGEDILDGGDTSTATDHLNVVNVLELKTSLDESIVDRLGGAVQVRLDHLLELLPLDHGADINVLHDGLDVDGGDGISGEDLLQLLGSGISTHQSLGVGLDVDLELILELSSEMVDKGTVEVAATEVSIVGSSLDVQLSLAELDDGASVISITNVDEANTARLLLSSGQVKLGDTVTESDGSSIVHESQGLETGNLGSIEERATLGIGEPGRNAENDVADGSADLSLGGGLDLAEEHGGKLGSSELLLVA